jgi:hypothetical protein
LFIAKRLILAMSRARQFVMFAFLVIAGMFYVGLAEIVGASNNVSLGGAIILLSGLALAYLITAILIVKGLME